MEPGSHFLTWIVPRGIAAMAWPTEIEIAQLRGYGVTSVLSLTEEAACIGGWVTDNGLRWLHLPIEDFAAPSMVQVAEAVGFISEEARRGNAVAVHCGAGLGRTGTIIACYLVATGMPPEVAIARVRAARPGSIETAAQEERVRGYASHLMAERSDPLFSAKGA
ncbi:dual specificity protein phosphatase family protein [Candidatus Fermentibacteria bacterium]|nr:dual specificity protein phosphatase family protein [Candidatus Fermentibacteria bacterium]